MEYRKGQMIYNQDQPSTSIYLVIDGKVKVSRLADDGHQVVVDIYQPDEFFGESAFLNLPHRVRAGHRLGKHQADDLDRPRRSRTSS